MEVNGLVAFRVVADVLEESHKDIGTFGRCPQEQQDVVCKVVMHDQLLDHGVCELLGRLRLPTYHAVVVHCLVELVLRLRLAEGNKEDEIRPITKTDDAADTP